MLKKKKKPDSYPQKSQRSHPWKKQDGHPDAFLTFLVLAPKALLEFQFPAARLGHDSFQGSYTGCLNQVRYQQRRKDDPDLPAGSAGMILNHSPD